MYEVRAIKERGKKKILHLQNKYRPIKIKLNIWCINNFYRGRIILSSDRLFWWETHNIKNFGDIVGPYLFEKIAGRKAEHMIPDNKSKYSVFVTVGSILFFVARNSIVWGSGIINRNDVFPKPYKTYAVRGPYTRKRFLELGYPCPEVYGDPAILLPKFYKGTSEKGFRLGIIPHYVDYEAAKFLYGKKDDIMVVNPLDEVETVINQILQCQYTVSSSLHGTIVSHAYNIPSIPIKLSDRLIGDGVKFKDYYASVELPHPEKTLATSRLYSVKDLLALVEDTKLPQDIKNLSENLLFNCPFLNKENLR